jgi:hypothetical protein
MSKETSLQFYQDTLVIQAAFGDARLMKYAEEGTVDQIISAVKDYVGGHIKEDDKIGSVINILAPGAVTIMLRSLGLGWLGFFAGLAMEIFHVDVDKYVQEIMSKLIPKLKAGEKVSSEEVATATETAFAPEIAKEPTQQELAQVGTYKPAYTVREALLLKMAMEEAVVEYKLTKNAAGIWDLFTGGKKGTVSLLAKAIKWIIMVVLASGGLMVAGDVANKIVGRPNAIDGSLKGGQPAPQAAAVPVTVSKQTKFKVNKSYDNATLNSGSTTWTESGPPNNSNIRSMVLDWMGDVYDGTDQYTNIASSSIGFGNVVKEIKDYNSGNANGRITYIPRMFPTKKSAVDIFIDEVADKSGPASSPTPNVGPAPRGSIYV